MSRRLVPLAAGAALLAASGAAAQGTRLLRHPAINGNAVAFEYGGDLWVTTRAGGPARRLTATPDVETDPHFSPDGSHIAFSRTSNGNTDVYVVSAAGGEPTRLTFHPGNDRARGWTPDGKRVVFASDRASAPQSSYFRMFTVPATGGFEEALPMPRAFTGTHSPDGARVAFEEISTAFIPDWYEMSMWRHYRGGRVHPISIIDLATNAVEKLPWQNSNDSDPMWIGNTVYFLSDRNYTRNLFSYNLATKKLEQLTHHDDADIMNASAGSDAIVYEQNGVIHLFDIKTGQSKALAIDVVGDFPWARPQFKRVASMIRDASLSPTGVRAAFEARGDIFTVPADKGDWRNLTKSPGAHDRNPVWSPDGAQLAWLSDAKGDDQLMIADQSGLSTPRAIPLPGSGYFSELDWSPNGKLLLVDDNHLNLWTVDVATGKATKLDEDEYNTPGRSFQATWSPDSRWVAYTKSLDSHMRAVFVRSLAEQQSRQLTDALADATSPSFDASGKYLYFLASTDYGPRSGWVEMSAVDRPSRRSVYLAVLSANDPSPLLPETGDEPAGAPAPRAKPDSILRVDFANIGQRILSLDVPAADYGDLAAGPAGTIFYSETVTEGSGRASIRLQRYQLRLPGAPAAGPGGASTFLEGIRSFTLSADRKKLLYSAGVGARRALGHRPDRGTGEGRRRRDERRGARELDRSARRVGGDLPRRAAAAARVLLRRQAPRRGLEGRRDEVRAARRVREPSVRPELPDGADRRRAGRRTFVHHRPRRRAERRAGERRAPRRRLHGGERPLSHPPRLHR